MRHNRSRNIKKNSRLTETIKKIKSSEIIKKGKNIDEDNEKIEPKRIK